MTCRQLAAEKVEKLVIMGGSFASGGDRLDYKIHHNLDAANNIADNWPGEIVYSGAEIGGRIKTGSTLTNPEINPVAMAYYLYPGAGGAHECGIIARVAM